MIKLKNMFKHVATRKPSAYNGATSNNLTRDINRAKKYQAIGARTWISPRFRISNLGARKIS